MLEVEGDAALVAVHDQERRGHAVDSRLAIPAGVIAAGQLFDLDDVGAQVGEHHPAGGPGHDLCQLEHAHAGERTGMRRKFRLRSDAAHRPTNTGFFLARNAA